jgi:bacillithiol system protein YtxJ
MTAGLFPDIMDKLLCQVLHVTPSGRMYGHTLLGAALSTLLVRKVWGARAAWAWALGYLGHLAADMDGFVPWLYPFREYDFEGEDIGLFRIVRRAIRNPIRVGTESALLIWAAFALVSRPRSAHQQNSRRMKGRVSMISECNKLKDFERLVADCQDKPVFLFKHSTSCPISASRWQLFQSFADREPRAAYHRVLVIQDRAVSMHVAQETGIRHQSPQVILLYRGKPVWDASHYSITEEDMAAALERALS